ncbi:MAG: hypothetical protein Q9217_006439 [Psora testacea]
MASEKACWRDLIYGNTLNRSEAACKSLSTVYVTVPGSPITETVYAETSGAQVRESFVNKNGMTVFQTVPATQVISVVFASAVLAKSTQTQVLTSILPTSSVRGTAKAYTGLAPIGWNATTFTTIKVASTGVAYPKPAVTEYDNHKPTSGSLSASAHHLKARDIGDSVVATIDGEVVSWSNSYEGSRLEISSAAASYTSSVAATKSPSPGATAESTSCGNSSARFTVTFDDLPHFSISNDPQEQDIPPIFNPYRKLYFEEHFGYVPPPSDPYTPHSPPQLAVYRASGTAADGSPGAGLEASGEIGAGPHASDSAYWIDAYSAYLGCSDGSSSSCLLTVHGYINGHEGPKVTQIVELPSCPGLTSCALVLVNFDYRFRGLSGFQINAAVGGKPVDYYMDDLKLGWSDNTCTAQLERSSAE